jgi:hypothetical protein
VHNVIACGSFETNLFSEILTVCGTSDEESDNDADATDDFWLHFLPFIVSVKVPVAAISICIVVAENTGEPMIVPEPDMPAERVSAGAKSNVISNTF